MAITIGALGVGMGGSVLMGVAAAVGGTTGVATTVGNGVSVGGLGAGGRVVFGVAVMRVGFGNAVGLGNSVMAITGARVGVVAVVLQAVSVNTNRHINFFMATLCVAHFLRQPQGLPLHGYGVVAQVFQIHKFQRHNVGSFQINLWRKPCVEGFFPTCYA